MSLSVFSLHINICSNIYFHLSDILFSFLLFSMDHQKLRTSNCFSCCFGGGGAPADDSDRPSLIRSSSTWFKEKAQDLPEFGERCRGLVDRIRWRRRPAGDFRYDALSYARNFDEGVDLDEYDDGEQGDAYKYRNFSSRLPASPQPAVVIA